MTVASQDALKSLSGEYVPYLVALLYCVFDPVAGPTVVSQVPEGSVATRLSTFPAAAATASAAGASGPSSLATRAASSSPARFSSTANSHVLDTNKTTDAISKSAQHVELNSTQVLFDFSSILDFVIPKPELCGHLITKATRTSKILGFPVRIVDEEKYHKGKEVYNRNTFTFNVCFVFERDAELSAFEPIVRKLGRTLRQVEETSSLLSSPPPTFHIGDLLEQIFMDINNYSETSIRIGDTDLELFLLPYFANPPKVHNWDVPVAVAPLEALKDPSWDVTLFKICSFINGVNHVKRIAELAEVDIHLARLCVQHLVYYGAVLLVDLFQYSNCYTALPPIVEVSQFGEEGEEGVTDLRTECEAYVYTGLAEQQPTPFATLLSLVSQLRAGLSVASWIDQNELDTKPIDVRRLIQFGVIKGFLRRVHAYPIWLDHPSLSVVSNLSRRNSSSMPELRTLPSQLNQLNVSPEDARPILDRNSSSVLSAVTTSSSGVHHSTSGQPTPRPRSPASAPKDEASRQRRYLTAEGHHDQRCSTVAHSASSNDRVRINSSAFHLYSIAGSGGGTGALAGNDTSRRTRSYPASLPLMLDGKHHADDICIKYGISFKQLEYVLKELGGANLNDGMEGEDEFASTSEEDSAREDEAENDQVGGNYYGPRVCMLYV
ncbi:Nitrogen permease regulator 2 [Microbotryomycetes sp. JL201]|nr:Nitrogen permease regulator 2 [Microbotryomycetes sp. JL201]